MDSEPTYVFIFSWERPIYLWACLDSLYRYTCHPHRFVLIDNHSTDPLVRTVVESFARRGMFHAVHRMPDNDPRNIESTLSEYRSVLGEYVATVESDVVVQPTRECWLAEMIEVLDERRDIAMLGSYLDGSDLVSLQTGRALHPEWSEQRLRAVLKMDSPERALPLEPPPERVISPFNPAGRLVLWRTRPLLEIGFLEDIRAHASLLGRGWHTGISTRVRHRHLSLLHIYDEPSYDVTARNRFFAGHTPADRRHNAAAAIAAIPRRLRLRGRQRH